MVKFSGLTKDGAGRLIGIALSRKNCEKLLEGQPIAVELGEFGLQVCDVPGGTGTKRGPPMPGCRPGHRPMCRANSSRW